jgi:hypothetical protein
LTLLTNSAYINYNYESTFNDLKKKKRTRIYKTYIMYLFVAVMVPTGKKITTL